MIAKLVSATGLVLLLGAGAMLIMASACDATDYQYALNISPDGIHHRIDGKPASGYFELSFAGEISWDFTNTTGDSVTVQIKDFESGYGGGCPVKFNLGGDGPSACSATKVIGAGATGSITAERGDSDPDVTTKYEFRFYVNSWPADPDIEIERDPASFLVYVAAAVGVVLLGVGWWLGRRRISAR